jgi:hypothetical protein
LNSAQPGGARYTEEATIRPIQVEYRQREGIATAKAAGKYKGRRSASTRRRSGSCGTRCVPPLGYTSEQQTARLMQLLDEEMGRQCLLIGNRSLRRHWAKIAPSPNRPTIISTKLSGSGTLLG